MWQGFCSLRDHDMKRADGTTHGAQWLEGPHCDEMIRYCKAFSYDHQF